MDTPQDKRSSERRAYRTKLTLTLDNGVCISGYSDNVSLKGLFLTPNTPPKEVDVGMQGEIRAEPDQDNLSFPCEVARRSNHGIGIMFRDERPSFGMFITHDIMLDLLAGINSFFARSLNLEETLRTGVDLIKDYLTAEAASLFLVENDGQDIVCRASAGPVEIDGMRLNPGEGIVGRSIEDGQALIVHDVRGDSRFAKHVDDSTGFNTESILCAPLVIQGRTIGAIEVLNKHGCGLFAGHDRIVLTVLASATAMAIQNARNAARFVQDKHDQVVLLERQVDDKIQTLKDQTRQEVAILDTIADAVIAIDKTGGITLFNVAADNMFGYQANALMGENISVLLPQEERSDHDGYLSKAKMHGPRMINKARDLQGLRKDGSLFPLELNVSPLTAETDTGYIGVLRDISDRTATKRARERDAGLHALMYSIGTAATECDNIEAMYQLCLDEICSYLQWPVGHVYLQSERDAHLLEPSAIWHLENTTEFIDFQIETNRTQFNVGVGLPGAAALSGKQVWFEDVTATDTFLRAKIAENCGIRSGMAIPVIVDNMVISVLEFFAIDTITADPARDRALESFRFKLTHTPNF